MRFDPAVVFLVVILHSLHCPAVEERVTLLSCIGLVSRTVRYKQAVRGDFSATHNKHHVRYMARDYPFALGFPASELAYDFPHGRGLGFSRM